MRGPRLLGTWAQWGAIALTAALGVALFALVDLEPEVQADFFFSSSDPQLRSTQRIDETYGYAPQVFVSAGARELVTRRYLLALRDLTSALAEVPGVESVKSLANGPEDPEKIAERDPEEVFEDLLDSPFWTRLLLAPDRRSTSVVIRLDEEADPRRTVRGIDRVLARFRGRGLTLGVSGVPYVAEHMRTSLSDDLRTFSLAALLAFTVIVALLFRSLSIVIGTLAAALAACFATFLARALLGMRTDVLTPNLWTITFVLTLSHVVYLATSWRRVAREKGAEAARKEAVLSVGPPAAWSFLANLLGFASLLFVEAKPLRQFGLSGGLAALAALLSAFCLFPPFLRSARVPRGEPGRVFKALDGFFTRRHGFIAVAFVIAALAVAPFWRSVETDPTLPSYFAEGSAIRRGLEPIDRSAGSSPLELAVRDAGGGGLDNEDAYRRLYDLQQDLERDPDVGSVVSIALLYKEVDRQWYSFLLPWSKRVKGLEGEKAERIGRSFLSQDRRLGRFILRMREGERTAPRAQVIARIEKAARGHGFEPELVGGLYRLQGDLARLVEASVLRGLGGLVGLFMVVTLITSRSLKTSIAMGFCLALVPAALFGIVGLAGMPLDIIAAPAANVALPLGIDEMIHLGYAVRRARGKGGVSFATWSKALAELWAPILASATIVVSGFSLFLLSRFPPTQRLGVLVCVGALLTDAVVLLVLPALATLGRRAR